MKEDNTIEQINSTFDALGLVPLSADEKVQQRTDPRSVNFQILKRQLRALGFGDVLADNLWHQMREQSPRILMPYHTLIGQDTVSCELSFTRSANGNYFWDHYTIGLSGTVEQTGLKYRKQTIPVEYYDTASRTSSLNESYNLLKGRWVNKQICNPDGEYYNDWIRYDMTALTTSGNYLVDNLGKDKPFDLAEITAQLPLADFGQHNTHEQLNLSLAQGNKEEVMVQLSSGSRTRFKVQANPLQNKLDIFLGNRRVYISNNGTVTIPGLKPPPTDRANVVPGYRNHNPLLSEKKRNRIKR